MTIAAAPDRRWSVTSALRAVELGSTALGVVLIGILHVVSPTNAMNPLTVTISQYGRSPLAAVFVSGVVLIALGSTATLTLLVQSGVCRRLVGARDRPCAVGRRDDGRRPVPEGRLGRGSDLRRIPAPCGIRHRVPSLPVAILTLVARGAATPDSRREAVGSAPPRGGRDARGHGPGSDRAARRVHRDRRGRRLRVVDQDSDRPGRAAASSRNWWRWRFS